MSNQAKNKNRKAAWKEDVAVAAEAQIPHGTGLVGTEVKVTITYYYEGESPDVDNIIKPIQDALIGIVYLDDNQVVEARSRKRAIGGSYKIQGASSVLLGGFANGDPFIHVRVEDGGHEEVLDE